MPKNHLRDKRIIKRRLRGQSIAEIAEKESMSKTGVFLAVKRLNPQLLTALRRNKYDLNKAVSKMIELTDASSTQYFAHNGVVTDQREIPDNKSRLIARTQMLKLHGQLVQEYQSSTQPMGNTQVMVILGASNDRMERLKSPQHTIIYDEQVADRETIHTLAASLPGPTMQDSMSDISNEAFATPDTPSTTESDQ